MELFYFPGACALAPHIVLEWSSSRFEATRIEKTDLKNPDYLKLNPTGQVPALKLDGGQIVTQAEAILMYLANAFPASKLGPSEDILERAEMHKWLSFLTGDLHPAFYPFFNPGKFIDDEELREDVKRKSFGLIDRLLTIVDTHLAGQHFMVENRRTILDPYLFVFCRWTALLEKKLNAYPNLSRFAGAFAADEGVRRALAAQGL